MNFFVEIEGAEEWGFDPFLYPYATYADAEQRREALRRDRFRAYILDETGQRVPDITPDVKLAVETYGPLRDIIEVAIFPDPPAWQDLIVAPPVPDPDRLIMLQRLR